MGTRTENLNLIKPSGDDLVDIAKLNENFDIIDGAVAGKVNTSQIVKSAVITEDNKLMDGRVASENFANINENLGKIQSHIGMIVHTTTLDTMQKVIDIYGGTEWTKIEGRFLLGQSSNYNINSTGGEATHTLTINEMPTHTHEITSRGGDGIQNGSRFSIEQQDNLRPGTASFALQNRALTEEPPMWASVGVLNNGGSQPHNNMPPYKTVYIWERTA